MVKRHRHGHSVSDSGDRFRFASSEDIRFKNSGEPAHVSKTKRVSLTSYIDRKYGRTKAADDIQWLRSLGEAIHFDDIVGWIKENWDDLIPIGLSTFAVIQSMRANRRSKKNGRND